MTVGNGLLIDNLHREGRREVSAWKMFDDARRWGMSWRLDCLVVETDRCSGVAHVVFDLLARRATY